jgi:hypothetical protein
LLSKEARDYAAYSIVAPSAVFSKLRDGFREQAVNAELERYFAYPRSENRPAQLAMAQAVASAPVDQKHLIAEVGTSVGKARPHMQARRQATEKWE